MLATLLLDNTTCCGSIEAVSVSLPSHPTAGEFLIFADPFELANTKLYSHPWKLAARVGAEKNCHPNCRHRSHVHAQTIVDRLESKAAAWELALELLAVIASEEKIGHVDKVGRNTPLNNVRLCYVFGCSGMLRKDGRNKYCQGKFVRRLRNGDAGIINPSTGVEYKVGSKDGEIWIIPDLTQPLYENGVTPAYDWHNQLWTVQRAPVVTHYNVWEKVLGEWRKRWGGWWTEEEVRKVWGEGGERGMEKET